MVRWRCTGALLGSNVISNPVRDMGGGIKELSSSCASGVELSLVADITLIIQYYDKLSKEWVSEKMKSKPRS